MKIWECTRQVYSVVLICVQILVSSFSSNFNNKNVFAHYCVNIWKHSFVMTNIYKLVLQEMNVEICLYKTNIFYTLTSKTKKMHPRSILSSKFWQLQVIGTSEGPVGTSQNNTRNMGCKIPPGRHIWFVGEEKTG